MMKHTKPNNNGFTLVELLISIAIIGILASIVLPVIQDVRADAYFARAKAEFFSFRDAVELYKSDHGGDYPPDADRDVPPGLEDYLGPGEWPDAAWPDSVFDWDAYEDPNDPGEDVYQISVRFCPMGASLDECNFPNQDWATDFEVNSSVYYCIDGDCRPHPSEDADYPGYCLNCD